MRKWMVAGIAVAIIAGTAFIAAAADGTSPSPSATPNGAARGRGLLFLHADGVAMRRDGTLVDIRAQKGLVQSIDATSITLKSPDGYVQTYAIDANTRVREKGQATSIDELKQGEMARVVAVKDGDGYTARLITCVGAPGPRLRKAFGLVGTAASPDTTSSF